MNEIDLFVNLLDENETRNILKIFNQNLKSDNLDFKKTKIKTLFRSQQPYKRSKKTTNPFLTVINKYQLDSFNNLSEKELSLALNEGVNKIPDYVKFANLITKFPDKIHDYLNKMDNNISNGKYLFDFGDKFETDEEVIQYYSKLAYINNEKSLKSMLNRLYHKAVRNNFISTDNSICEGIENWSLIDMYYKTKDETEENSIILKYHYLKTHQDINKDVLTAVVFDILEFLVDTAFDKKDSGNKEHKNLDEYINEIETLKKDNKELETEVGEKYKEIKKTTKANKEIINTQKVEIENLKVQVQETDNYKESIKELNSKNQILNSKLNELKNKLNEEKKKVDTYKKQMKDTYVYYEYAFGTCEPESEKLFGLIHTMEINISKTIFNEVEFIPLSDWKNNIDDVKCLYIQREGISTRKLNEIKNYCTLHGITSKVISINNEKNLIETISIIKNNRR